MNKRKGGLGKGLSAIFIENETEDQSEVVVLSISDIEPNRAQPRKDFDDESLKELSDSILEHGVLQPILVRPLIGGGYQIVAGERRYRASRLAGLQEIPVMIRELSDEQTMELALIENLQRENLSPLEEAQGYKSLIDDYSLSQEQVAKTVGKSRSAVANTIRLLSLPDGVKELLKENKLSAGHARALLSIENDELILFAAKEVAEKNLSVRETESLCKKLIQDKPKKAKKTLSKSSYFSEVELTLSEYLGKKVIVTPSKNKKGGMISIEFYSDEDLADIANRLEEKI